MFNRTLLLALAALYGCIESNPQPSPGTKDAQYTGHDSEGRGPDTWRAEDEFGGMHDVVTPGDLVSGELAADLDSLTASDGGDVESDVEDALDLEPGDLDAVDSEMVEVPQGCCLTAEHCGEGSYCVPVSGDLQWGKCLPELEAGECWHSGECNVGQGEYCSGAMVNSCLSVLAVVDSSGHCVHDDPPFCCYDDAPCGPGTRCVMPQDGSGGTCEPVPAPGGCWADSDCYTSQTCVGAQVPGCHGTSAEGAVPGLCSPLPSGCCYVDTQCGPGLVCRAAPTGSGQLPGACVPDPTGTNCDGAPCCWADTDCSGGLSCVGAAVCGCIELCWDCGACAPDQLGRCL